MYNILKRLQVRRTAVTILHYYNIIMYILKNNNDINCFLQPQKCQMIIFPTRHKK